MFQIFFMKGTFITTAVLSNQKIETEKSVEVKIESS